jgi:ActR/RegA family two-component response regulator
VLLTGYASDAAAIAVGGAITGAFSLLRKPVRIHDLVDRIRSLLAARAKQR